MLQRSDRKSRLAGLDTLRAIAIVLVMLFHLRWQLPDGFGPVGRFGWIGVDLFFVLSGYLIGSQLLKSLRDGRGISLTRFYRNRAYRILPVYLVVLGLYVLWPAWREASGMSPLWQFLTFSENLFVDYSKNQAFSHAWSLCVEEHFYLLFPIIVLMLSRKAAAWKAVAVLAFFFALGMGIRSYLYFHLLLPMGRTNDSFSTRYIELIYYPTYTRLDGLLAGVALALVRVFRSEWWTAMLRRSNVLLVTGVTLLGLALWIVADRFGPAATLIGFPMLALGFAMLVAAAADASCWFGRMRLPGTKVLATLAYSLYLTHKEVAHLDQLYLPRIMVMRDWRSVVLICVSCIAASALLYFAVERPFLALRDRREGRSAAEVDVEVLAEPAL